MKFGVILSDPPWERKLWSEKGRKSRKAIEDKYPCMKLEALKALPVAMVAEDNCMLLLWTTWAHLVEAQELIASWGFVYKTGLPMVKRTRKGKIQPGMGKHVRHVSEVLLYAMRGRVICPPPPERLVGLIETFGLKHSRKPDDQYAYAERYPGPYWDMFCRPGEDAGMPFREDSTFTGNEITGNDIVVDMERLRWIAGGSQMSLFGEGEIG